MQTDTLFHFAQAAAQKILGEHQELLALAFFWNSFTLNRRRSKNLPTPVGSKVPLASQLFATAPDFAPKAMDQIAAWFIERESSSILDLRSWRP